MVPPKPSAAISTPSKQGFSVSLRDILGKSDKYAHTKFYAILVPSFAS